MDVHRETVRTPGIAFAGHGYYWINSIEVKNDKKNHKKSEIVK